MSLDHTQRSYAAGVIDCDGSIYVANCGKSQSPHLRVAVYNTRRGLIDWFADKYGGTVGECKRGGRSREYSWTLYGRGASTVLMDILPYLVIKREQALLAIEFISTLSEDGGTTLPADVRDLRARLRNRLRELNRKGAE